jgi:hypothetical protein
VLAAAIQRLHDDPARREELSRDGRAALEQGGWGRRLTCTSRSTTPCWAARPARRHRGRRPRLCRCFRVPECDGFVGVSGEY